MATWVIAPCGRLLSTWVPLEASLQHQPPPAHPPPRGFSSPYLTYANLPTPHPSAASPSTPALPESLTTRHPLCIFPSPSCMETWCSFTGNWTLLCLPRLARRRAEGRGGCSRGPRRCSQTALCLICSKPPPLWKPTPSNYTTHCPPPHHHHPLTKLPTPLHLLHSCQTSEPGSFTGSLLFCPSTPSWWENILEVCGGHPPLPLPHSSLPTCAPPSPPPTRVLHHAFPVSLPMTTGPLDSSSPASHSVTMSCSAN